MPQLSVTGTGGDDSEGKDELETPGRLSHVVTDPNVVSVVSVVNIVNIVIIVSTTTASTVPPASRLHDRAMASAATGARELLGANCNSQRRHGAPVL